MNWSRLSKSPFLAIIVLCCAGGMSVALALQPVEISETDVEENDLRAESATIPDLSSEAAEPAWGEPAEDGSLKARGLNGSAPPAARSRGRSPSNRPSVGRTSSAGQPPGPAGNGRPRESTAPSPRSNRKVPGPVPERRASAPNAAERERGGSPAPASSGYGKFRMILDRNIFNATRLAESRRPRSESRSRAEISFTLVGTLSSEKGQYAFFDGSSAEYRKVLETGQSIGTYKLATIGGGQVRLEASTNAVQLQIGMQMRLEESGWQTVGVPTILSAVKSAAAASRSDSGGEESDIVKRLMEQREKEQR